MRPREEAAAAAARPAARLGHVLGALELAEAGRRRALAGEQRDLRPDTRQFLVQSHGLEGELLFISTLAIFSVHLLVRGGLGPQLVAVQAGGGAGRGLSAEELRPGHVI